MKLFYNTFYIRRYYTQNKLQVHFPKLLDNSFSTANKIIIDLQMKLSLNKLSGTRKFRIVSDGHRGIG